MNMYRYSSERSTKKQNVEASSRVKTFKGLRPQWKTSFADFSNFVKYRTKIWFDPQCTFWKSLNSKIAVSGLSINFQNVLLSMDNNKLAIGCEEFITHLISKRAFRHSRWSRWAIWPIAGYSADLAPPSGDATWCRQSEGC